MMARINYLNELEQTYKLTESQEEAKNKTNVYLYTFKDEIEGNNIDHYARIYKKEFRRLLKKEYIKPFLLDLFFLNIFKIITEENKKKK